MTQRLQNLLLVVGTIAVLLIVLELPAALRLIDYRAVFRTGPALATGKPWQNPYNRADDQLLWIHRPQQHITGKAVGDMVAWLGIATDRLYPVDVTYDRNGFRNARDLDSAAVVLIGDSFLEWSNVGQADLLGGVLERRLGEPVANLGQSGYGPRQERIVLTRFGLPLRPRVVVWEFFEGNDLTDLARYDDWIGNWARIRAQQDAFSERSFLHNAWRTAVAVATRPSSVDAPTATARACKVVTGQARDSALYFAYSGLPLQERELTGLAKVESIITDAQAEARRQGVELVLMFVPTKFRVYGSLCTYPPEGEARKWVVNDMPERLAAWAATGNLPFLDLTPALRAAALNGPLLYFIDDGHWSPRGHQVAADTLAEFLRVRGTH
ncbi:MAG: GDSL-type esterase/lipase family protein [Gemmatimonadales bacterium]